MQLTAYTASSAAALVADASSGSINSIDDVIAMGATVKVCVRTAMAGKLTLLMIDRCCQLPAARTPGDST
jgi:hypothetical protein